MNRNKTTSVNIKFNVRNCDRRTISNSFFDLTRSLTSLRGIDFNRESLVKAYMSNLSGEMLKEFRQINLGSSANETTIILYSYKTNNAYVGISHCHPDDDFDSQKGINYAMCYALDKADNTDIYSETLRQIYGD